MKATSSQLKASARGHLTGRYALPIIAYMLARMIINVPSLLISYTVNPATVSGSLMDNAVSLILTVIMTIFMVGQNHICLQYARSSERLPMAEMWYGFKGRADEIIITYFLIFVRYLAYGVPFILMFVLYIMQPANIPIILLLFCSIIFMAVMYIKVELDYALVYFLIVDHPEVRPKQLLIRSKQLMQGNRSRLFYIQLSFIGMYLLGLLSFGLAMFWIYPYVRMTMTEFYLELIQSNSCERAVAEPESSVNATA